MLLGAVALLSACHEPEYVAPTADRQGITSLTAIFTSGPFEDKEMAKLTISDPTADRFVIEVPWFYPETSDDETEQYMTKVRVQAELQPNCFIEPKLTILDLTQDNYFTYTDAQGNKTKICITGERVKSNKCELQAFSIIEPAISGIVDKVNKKVSLIAVEDLSAVVAEAQISAHATITPDPSTVRSYEEEVEFTVTAHNGVDKTVYTVVKEIPEKIASGFVPESVEELFTFDPVTTLGMPAASAVVTPTIAAINGHLILCMGDGTTPVYLNRITGVKLGTINLGSAVAGSITSDENNNMLIVNRAMGGETVNIYRTSSVTEAPTLFHSFANVNAGGLPCGAKIKVIGNIDEDALITLVHEGVAGVTTSSKFTVLVVSGGTVVAEQVFDLSAAGISWNTAPVNFAAVVPASINPADGVFHTQYGPSFLSWIKSDGTIGFQMNSDLTGWGLNPHSLDSKRFNNVNYLALFVTSHFPHWGMGPQLYLYDTSNPAAMAADDVSLSSALVLANGALTWYQKGYQGTAAGDVLIAPTADGYKLYVYYYDHNSQALGGYVADCIKD